MRNFTVEEIAKIAHVALNVFVRQSGIGEAGEWEEIEDSEKEIAIALIRDYVEVIERNPDIDVSCAFDVIAKQRNVASEAAEWNELSDTNKGIMSIIFNTIKTLRDGV